MVLKVAPRSVAIFTCTVVIDIFLILKREQTLHIIARLSATGIHYKKEIKLPVCNKGILGRMFETDLGFILLRQNKSIILVPKNTVTNLHLSPFKVKSLKLPITRLYL